MTIAKPTKQQLAWHEMELGVLIHYCLEMYRPELPGEWYKTSLVREALAPETIHPAKLDPEQWVRCAAGLGAKYAVLVAKHGTGFALWETKVNDFSIAHTDWRGGGGDVCRAFRILADGKPVYESACVGHKRIVPFENLTAADLVVEITKAVGEPVLRDVAVY